LCCINIDGQDIRIEENWSNEIEVKIDKIHIATIKANEFTFKTTIFIDDNLRIIFTFCCYYFDVFYV